MAAKELLAKELLEKNAKLYLKLCCYCLLYTSDAADD